MPAVRRVAHLKFADALQVRPGSSHSGVGAGHQQRAPGQPGFNAHAFLAAAQLQVCSVASASPVVHI